MLGAIFLFYPNFDRIFCKHTVETDPDQTAHSAVSDLGLHCLPMSHKKDTKLIWVKELWPRHKITDTKMRTGLGQ